MDARPNPPRSSSTPRVAIVVGYFDWFSGYQETALAAALSRVANVEVICSDRVSPAFSNAHLGRLGLSRTYEPGTSFEHGVTVTRLQSIETRSMVWSRSAIAYLRGRKYDLCVQVMPGQVLPVAATVARVARSRVVLYGDNRAMYEGLPLGTRILKLATFAVTKGLLYVVVNANADWVYGYTPNTLKRLQPFSPRKKRKLMPLAYDEDRFYYSLTTRKVERELHGYGDDDIVFLVAGKFEHRKRLDWTLSAFEAFRDSNAHARLLLVGADDGPYSDSIRDRVAESKFADNIRVMPFQDAETLNRIMNSADIGIWPKQPAITIQQALGTGLIAVVPDNDLVGHLVSENTGVRMDNRREGANEILKAMHESTALRIRVARQERADTNRWLGASSTAVELLSTI